LDVDQTYVTGRWWRHIPADGDVHHQSEDPAASRWQRGEVVDALYFGDTPDTVWAEWYRFLAEAGVPPMAALPRDLWEWEISLPRVADLSDGDRLKRLGLPQPTPGRTQWPQFQPVGEALHAAGWPALLAPSAARPNSLILCVFRTQATVPGTEPVPPPERFEEPPAVPRGMTT
jgi:hypothetical protein